jgi:3-deoxy-D-manno-octulosonate 8-phosphate phosphatase (KDO 8-P phosphatase)
MGKIKLEPELLERAAKVRLLLMDCDGVLTDGRLYFTSAGEAMKVFNVRDGQGIAEWHRAGFKSGIISGRESSGIIERRAQELGIHFVKLAVKEKAHALDEILRESNFKLKEVAFIGDDVPDIQIMQRVAFPVVVHDGAKALTEFCVYRTKENGGCGAVREVTDLLLAVKNKRGKKSD